MFPSAAEFKFHLGNILGKRSEFNSAEEMYLEAISIGDRDKGDDLTLFHSNLGVLYHRYSAIKTPYNNECFCNSQMDTASTNLSPIMTIGNMFRWKRYPEAAKAYEEAIRLDPNNRSAKKNLESVRRNML